MSRSVLRAIFMLGVGMQMANAEDLPLIYPPALLPGDTIAVVAPAGVLQPQRVERAQKRLEEMGFKVRIPADLYRKRGYLAGDDAVRAEELMAAFRDPQVKAIFPGTGGFGTTRMLDRLDYTVIRQNPKVFIGFSDITGLHLAIQKKARIVTFHSPVVMYGLGSDDGLSTFSAEYFWRALLASRYLDKDGKPMAPGYAYATIPSDAPPIKTLYGGIARGRLTGGNLSLICPLLGTPYEIETDGKILFIEDTNEEPYRIDRYLSHLRLAGKLDHVAGVILGIFTGCDPKRGDDGLSLEQVFRDYFEKRGVPVIMGFPVGHSRYNATLPLSVLAELDADAKRVRLLENPVQPEPGER